MTDRLFLLVREAERLVTAPYAPALQDLHDIVRQSSQTEIHYWAFCKPCQVGLLGDVLVEALSRSALSLQLLCTFASIPSFRNALLERHPTILDRFLQKAVEDGDPEYLPACTALLSSPLPSDFITPARLSPFIMKLVCKMGGSPCAETIFPLYQLMAGLQASSTILDTVPLETMSIIQVEFTKTLRNLDDHMGNLLCLATFARIASSRKTDIENQHGLQPPSWLQNIRHFFGPKRALKTLELVVLRVILACSASCSNLPAGKAAESIRLAIDICDAVELEQKKIWINGNSSKIAKLCEKVTRDGISHEVQMMGVAFVVSLLPANALPPQITSLCQQGLLLKDSRCVLESIPRELIPRMVEAVAISSGPAAVCEFLNYAFFALKDKDTANYDSLGTVHLANLFLSGMQRLGSQLWSPSVIELVTALGRTTLGERLTSFPRRPCQSQCEGSNACYAAVSACQNDLFLDLLDLYSRSTVSRTVNDETAIPHDLDGLLVAFMAQVRKLLAETGCSFATTQALDTRNAFSLLSTREKRSDHRSICDWRAGLAETLMTNARASHESMLKKVEEICYDLEHRCYNTEAPLRAVEEERNRLVSGAEQLKKKNENLQSQLQQASNSISTLQQDMARLEKHAERASRRSEELSTNLDDARRELEDQRRQHEEAAHAEREKARTTELDLIATVTEKDDQLEELQGELHEQRSEVDELRNTLDTVSKEKATTLQDSALLRQQITKLEEFLETNKLLLSQKDEEVTRLLTDKECMSSEIKALETKLGEETSESNRLRSALHTAEERSNLRMEALKQEHELAISHAAAESTKERQKNESLHAAMQEAATNATKELQTKDRRIQHLENKVQSLRNERAAKAREFSEAQQHIGRLMSVMGFKADPAATKGSSKHRRSKSRLEPSQSAMTQQDNIASPRRVDDADFPSDNLLGESFESVTSNSSGGPSPKRSRGNFDVFDAMPMSSRNNKDARDLKPNDLHHPRSSMRQRRERIPLGDANPNNSPTKSQFGNNTSHSKALHLQDEACPDGHIPDENRDIDLDDDDMDLGLEKELIFTSTAFPEADDHFFFTQETQG